MNDIELQKLAFRPICNNAEIERIFSVQNAADQLLKLRAETIIDHMRLFRVYRNKALLNENTWSLEASFSNEHYHSVLRKLPPQERELCKSVTFGDIFSNDPNGMIFPTEYGPITTISDSLKYFLKFSHLALLDSGVDVPPHIRQNALRIAIRVMLQTETMDFLMDPRGIVPSRVANTIHAPIKLQMQFIAGHEFSHFILGHLSESNLIEQPVFYAVSKKAKDYKPIKIYNNSQKNELAADLNSILLPKYSSRKRGEILHAALLWFGCLELYQVACDVMFPVSSWTPRSHPTARERYENLLTNIPTPNNFDIRPWAKFPKLIDQWAERLREDISLNFDFYEMYGSAYLDEPNTEWRGRELIDRVDYY